MLKNRKVLLIIGLSIISTALIFVAFISPITKYLIEKYDSRILGRKITLDWAYVNPFTGYIYFNDVRIHELESDSIFLSIKGLQANIAMLKLFSGNYELSKLSLIQPRGAIIQNKTYLNINDLIAKFSGIDTTKKVRDPVHLNILNIEIKEGEFYYTDQVIPVNFFIKHVNLKSSGKRWDVDTICSEYSFSQGDGKGEMEGDFTINLDNKDYRLAVKINDFDLNIVEQYLRDLTNFGSFSALLNADIKADGNLNLVTNITTSGVFRIDDFHFGKNPHDDYISFDNVILAIHELSPEKLIYSFDSISINRPYFKYELYDSLDNLQTMFGRKGENIETARLGQFNLVLEIADYIKLLTQNFLQGQYLINRLAIYNGNLKYNDYSISEKFSAELNPFTIISDSIDRNRDLIKLSLISGIFPYGKVKIEVSINPDDSSDFDLEYHIGGLPATMFNPYLISQTSFPLDRGTIEVDGTWVVRNTIIKSSNHLVIIDPRIANRVINKELKWLPMRPIVSLVRERGNVVDYDIPISGNLKDPNFKVKDIIYDLLENIFVKPVNSNYIGQVKHVEREIENSLALTWETRHGSVNQHKVKFIKKMAKFLDENPEAFITVIPQNYILKEKEYTLYYEAKKRYSLQAKDRNGNPFNEEDSTLIENMSVKDGLFVQYLNDKVQDSTIFTILEKCELLLDSEFIDSRLLALGEKRKSSFLSFFEERGVSSKVHFDPGENTVPYNGFSFYKISYNGNFPDELIESYRKMNEFDDEKPRKKFKVRRSENNQSR